MLVFSLILRGIRPRCPKDLVFRGCRILCRSRVRNLLSLSPLPLLSSRIPLKRVRDLQLPSTQFTDVAAPFRIPMDRILFLSRTVHAPSIPNHLRIGRVKVKNGNHK